MVWINNSRDTLTLHGKEVVEDMKVKIHSKDSLTEYMSNGTGWWGSYVKNNKDSLNIPYLTIPINTNINGETYTQNGETIVTELNIGVG